MRPGIIMLRSLFMMFACVTSAQAMEPLTLGQAMHRAIASNPTIRSQRTRVERQRLEKDVARGQRWPRLDVFTGYTLYAYPSLVTPIREANVFPPLDNNIVLIGVSLRLPLYAGGRLVAGESLAAHGLEAEREALRAVDQDLLHDVITSYTKALHLRDLQVFAQARIAALEAEQTHLSEQLEEGRISRLELVRLKTRLSQARYELLTIEQGERDALSLLAALLGTSEALPALADVAPIWVELPDSQEEALARATRLHPTLRRAEALENVASDGVDIANAARLPRIELLAQAWESAGMSTWKGYDYAQVGVEVRMPLFEGWTLKNRVAQAKLEQRARKFDVDATRDRLIAEVHQAWGAVVDSHARLAVARQGEREGEEALSIEKNRYEEGENTITDLLDVDAALWGARVSRLQAGYDVTASQARLLHAIGELTPDSFDAGDSSVGK